MLRGRDRAPYFLQSVCVWDHPTSYRGEPPISYRMRNPLLGWKEACLRQELEMHFPAAPAAALWLSD